MKSQPSNPPGRPREKDSVLTILSDAGRLRKNPDHVTGKNKWLVRCDEKRCKAYLVYDPKNKFRVYTCREHKGAQMIAGRLTASKYWLRWQAYIVSWRKRKQDNKTQHCPLAKCAEQGCSKLVFFPTEKRVIDRTNLRCRTHFIAPNKLRPYEVAYRRLHSNAKEAVRRGKRPVEISLTYEQFAHLAQVTCCFYCNSLLNRELHIETRGNRAAVFSYLDRTNTLQGYDVGNVVPCCGVCNKTKNAWLTKKEMQVIGAMRQGKYRHAVKHVHEHKERDREEGLQLMRVIQRSRLYASSGCGRPAKLKKD